MNARRNDSTGAMEKLGTRVRQRALSGTEASTIGIVLVAYIGVFAGLGYWLDTLFKTSWIVAVGVLLGAAIGFREMFRMALKLTRESIVMDGETERAKLSQAYESKVASAPEMSTPEVEEAHERPRIFAVPPPPSASFDKSKFSREEPSTAIEDEELIERLLEDEEDENEEAR
jgi:F0F1-type ATP synthase assembly protein I